MILAIVFKIFVFNVPQKSTRSLRSYLTNIPPFPFQVSGCSKKKCVVTIFEVAYNHKDLTCLVSRSFSCFPGGGGVGGGRGRGCPTVSYFNHPESGNLLEGF